MTAIERLESLLTRIGLAMFRALGPSRASNLGGVVAAAIGPLLPVSRAADRNLRAVFSNMDRPARRRLIRETWDNLGRTIAELPHLPSLELTDSGPGFAIQGSEHVCAGRAIYVSAHFGNWEALPVIAARHGVTVAPFYRAAKNVGVDAQIQALRKAAVRHDAPMFAKGVAGARSAVSYLSRGGALGLLVDQKLNDGILVPFLNIPAMTTPAAAAFALRFRCPVIPVYIIRTGPARLEMIVEPPLPVPDSGDRNADIHHLTNLINTSLGEWILKKPGAWLWLHRRWPKEVVEGAVLR